MGYSASKVPPVDGKRVARLWLERQAALSFDQAYQLYKKTYEEAYSELLEFGVEAVTTAGRAPLWVSVFRLFLVGHELCKIILSNREIPKAKFKSFEKANRTFARKNPPKKGNSLWFVKNLKDAQFLLESKQWPERGQDSERGFTVGPFSVLNQTHHEPDAVVKLLQSGLNLLQKSKVPSIGKALYGDVLIVGEVNRNKNLMAEYYPSEDLIRISMVSRFSEKLLHNLIHELGHRYWRKNLPRDPKVNWMRHHSHMKNGDYRTELPKVGEVLDLVKGSPKMKGFVSHKGKMCLQDENGALHFVASYAKSLSRRSESQSFPTSYASTDEEEHFCEALALYSLGELKEPHKTNFETIIVSGGEAGFEGRVASPRKVTTAFLKSAPVGTAIDIAPNSKARALASKYGGEPNNVTYLKGKLGWTSNIKLEPGGKKGVAQLFYGPFFQESEFALSAKEGTITVLGQFEVWGEA